MRKLAALTAAVALVTVFGFATTASADPKVTGGASLIDSLDPVRAFNPFSLTVNVIETQKGLKGSIEFGRNEDNPRAELFLHATVQCYGISGDGMNAIAAGPAEVQSDEDGVVSLGD